MPICQFAIFDEYNKHLLYLQVYFCYETPASHPFITVEERDYLQQELGQLERDKEQSSTPWKDILTSKAVLAFVLGMVSTRLEHY